MKLCFVLKKTHVNKNKIKSTFAECLLHRSYLLCLLGRGLRFT